MKGISALITGKLRRSVLPVLLAAVVLGLTMGGAGIPASAAATGSLEAPNATCPAGGQCFADVPPSNPFYEFANRIYMQDLVSGYACGGAGEPCDADSRPYYRPGAGVTRQQMSKFIDNARRLPEIRIDTATILQPVYSRSTATGGVGLYGVGNNTGVQGDGTVFGVYGTSTTGNGVYGLSNSGNAVEGYSDANWGVVGRSGSAGAQGGGVLGEGRFGVVGIGTEPGAAGVYGENHNGRGVYGRSNNSTAVYGQSVSGVGVDAYSESGTGLFGSSTTGTAGYFQGNVQVTGTCTGCLGSTRMDHPLDPENKFLSHSGVASPDMMNVYNGNVTLDARGEAAVQMPDWFDALNKEFRYQLTAIGAPGPNLYIAQEIADNSFRIAGGTPNSRVSWQVTGIRQDPYANEHRIAVEEEKNEEERGKYLHPTEWGQPESDGIGYRSPAEIEQLVPGVSNGEK